MKIHIVLIISIGLLCLSAKAQVVDKTEQKAKDKTNQRIDNKIDRGLDKGLDAVEGLFSKKKKSKTEESANTENDSASDEGQADKAMGSIFGGSVDVEDSYSFEHNFVLELVAYDKKGKPSDPVETKILVAEDDQLMGIETNAEGAESMMVYDIKKKQFITMVNSGNEKMGFAMAIKDSDLDQSDKYDPEDVSFTKTGNKKTISGYNCEEYLMTNEADDKYIQTIWVAPDVDGDWVGAMRNMMSSNKKMAKEYALPENYPDGAMIQIISQSTKNAEKSITTVKEMNRNDPQTIKTSGYKFMSLGGGQ